jgi:uncharacterized protein YjbI with pentapeptide repeats
MLDSVRRGSLIRFLSQTSILQKCIVDELDGIDLSGTDLTFVNLSKINLNEANLMNADLMNANLSGAILVNVNLKEASLIQANLSGAILIGAILTRADLSGANLTGAYFNFADLSDDDLSEVFLPYATERGLSLSTAIFSRLRSDRAILSGTFLRKANLKGAIGVTLEELEEQAKSLQGATMPDGSIYP